MRIFSIADIHGEADKLASLLVLLKKHNGLDLTKDKLVFTGDYIDRGKDSYKVLALIYELQKEFPNNIVALAGNHEWIMIDYHLYKYDGGLWHANGGKATEKSFYKHHGSKKCPGHLLSWLMNMPLFHVEDGFFFSHAPLLREGGIGSFSMEELTWGYLVCVVIYMTYIITTLIQGLQSITYLVMRGVGAVRMLHCVLLMCIQGMLFTLFNMYK